jgi:hypothetical protein
LVLGSWARMAWIPWVFLSSSNAPGYWMSRLSTVTNDAQRKRTGLITCWDLATKSDIVDKIDVESKSENIGI